MKKPPLAPILVEPEKIQLCIVPPELGVGGLFLSFLLLGLLTGCAPQTTSAHTAPEPAPTTASSDVSSDVLAPGVIHRAIPTRAGSGVDLVDIDLTKSHCRLSLQTQGIILSDGHVVGQAYTPHEWLTRLHGIMAVNGGYFGAEDQKSRKEFVGLLVQKGRVRHAAPPLLGAGSSTTRRGRYVRSAFGLMPDGAPSIVWAATSPGHSQNLMTSASPMGRTTGGWNPVDAVGCGPTLIAEGRSVVTEYQERLVSPGPEPRTFVAYDGPSSQPRHLVVGIASGADFSELAAFLTHYFSRYDHSRAEAAMCLDGGASTQMTYTLNGVAQSPRETGITVPDALVLLSH